VKAGEPYFYQLKERPAVAFRKAPPTPPEPLKPEKSGIYGGNLWRRIIKDPDPAAPTPARGGGFGVRDALTLSQGYKCTHSFVLEVSEGGGRLTLRQPASEFETLKAQKQEEPPEWGGGDLVKALHGLYDGAGGDDGPRRGRISEWSDPSRRNFRKFMGGLQLGALDGGMMVGITYPDEFPDPESHEVYKGHLRTFEARFLRRYPNGSFVWKLEFQERGAAHFHCVFFGLGAGDAALAAWRDWSKKAWWEVVGSGCRHHRVRGVSSDWIKTRGGAVGYLTKYLAKEDQTRPGDFTGRYWGAKGRKNLPIAPVRKSEKPDREALLIRRVMRKRIESDVKARRKAQLLKKLGLWAEWGASVMDMEAWNQKPGCDRFMPSVTPQWTGPSRLSLPNPAADEGFGAPRLPFHMPPRFRTKNNLSVTLFCDASAVAASLEKWAADLVRNPYRPDDRTGRKRVQPIPKQGRGNRLFSVRPGPMRDSQAVRNRGLGEGFPPAGSREGWNPF